MLLRKEFRFEASHRLPYHKGKCARLHGHSWVLIVEVEGPVSLASGMVMDYGEIKAAVQPVVEDLDHRHLGTWKDLEGYVDDVGINCWGVHWLPYDFNSTSENLLLAIAKQLPDSFAWSSLTLKETCTCEAILQREEFQGDSNAK